MKKHILNLGLIAAMAAFSLQVSAKPAKQGVFSVSTSDGGTLNVRLTGDEFYHQYFTEDGYPLFEKDGCFYYCDFDSKGDVINSGIKAGQMSARGAAARDFLSKVDMSTLEERIQARAAKSPRRALMVSSKQASYKSPSREADGNDGPPYERGYGLFPDIRFPAYGQQKAIVILVEYTDVKFNTGYDAKDYFTRMLNEDNFADYGATGSAAQFFRENSEGAFVPEFDVYGPLTLAHDMEYYGGNGWGGDDQNPGAMVKEACDQLDDIVDFNDYDRNHDGIVDNVFIFYAGRGEASGGSPDTVWPHSWNMTQAGFPDLYYDGVKLHTYGCSNEWEGGRPDGVGTFVHEFSHVIGLPDLYATRYTGAFTPGSWSALDYGPYNNDGMTPPNYGAFERYALGWVKPREIDRAVSATLQPIDQNVCGIIRSSDPKEFFLVENRQQTGWDAYIPGHGMLIWHVDYDDYVWSSNSVNNSSSHQYVDIEEADGSQSDYSRSGDTFPGTSHKTSFTSTTSPAMKTWSNQALNFPMTNIAEAGGMITFDVLGGGTSDLDVVEANDAEDVRADSFKLSWAAPAEGNDIVLNVYTRPEAVADGEVVYLPGFQNRNMGQETSVVVTGAEATTTYYYTVAQTSGWETSLPSEEKSLTTTRYTVDYYAVEATEATDMTTNSFVANWLALEDATGYEVNVYTKEIGDPYFETNGFANGIDDLGDWTVSSSVTTYGMASYAGEAVPSLRLPNAALLTTPSYSDYINRLTFWHRGNNTTTGDKINVYAVTESGQQLVQTVDVNKAVGGETVTVDNFPPCTLQAKIQFVRQGEKGNLALDDVTVGHGYQFEPVPVAGYINFPTGNVLSQVIEGLDPNIEYFYTVRATDGTLFSQPSNEIRVVTLATGLSNVASDGFGLWVNGLNVLCTSADEIIVADYTGALVGRGSHKVTLPRAGLYIVSVPSKNFVKKLIVR